MNDPVHTKRGSRWAVVTVAVMLAGYVGSYFVLTEKRHMLRYHGTVGVNGTEARRCRYPWMAGLFRPLAALEKAVTGDNVSIH